MLSTAHALKIANMETRLKVKSFKLPFFKVTLNIYPSYVDKGVIIFVVKLKMMSRDPLIGKWDDNEWDTYDYSF